MKRNIFRIIILFAISILFPKYAYSLEVLYPQVNPHKTSSSVTYIMGNVKPGSKLTINGTPAKVWKNGAYCKTVNLKPGENVFRLTEINKKTGKHTSTVTVTRHIANSSKKAVNLKPTAKNNYKNFPGNKLMYATVTTDGAPVRAAAGDSSERITHLPLKTVVLLEGQKGSYYKISTGEANSSLWIYKKNVKITYALNQRITSDIRNTEFRKDKDFAYMTLSLEIPVAFKTEEKESTVELTLYGIRNIDSLKKASELQLSFPGFEIKDFSNNNLVLAFPSTGLLWGYEATYSANDLIFKKRTEPNIVRSKPFSGLIIAIDPGHGGKEAGAVGPTRIPEKNVNLDIALKLQKELEKEGAKTVMTRTDDSFVGLYKRPDIANLGNAIICLSIHSNSLVDADPFKQHGTSVFYYHPQAKELARVIKSKMIKDSGLRDDGLKYASFVLTRPTIPVSVLIEVAYMPNPNEYQLLCDEKFRKKTAVSIKEGLKKYLLDSVPEGKFGIEPTYYYIGD